MRWHFVVLWPQKSMAVLWMTECHTHSFSAGSVEMDVSEENGHSPHSIHSHRLMNRTGTFCIWSLLSFSRWCLFFPCLLARHVSRRHPLCCWVAPSLEVLKLGSSVLQAACSWLFVIFPVFGFFFAVSFWMAVACQQRLCTNPHHSHISAWNQCPAGGVLRVLHPQLQCTEWRKMQTRCFSKNCGLLFAACCSQSVWGASLLQLETLMKTRATHSPALISCPFPCHCHEVKETLLLAQINFILSSLIRVYPWIKHLHCAFTEVYCLDFVVLSSLWYREKKFQVFKLSVATAVLAGCGFSMWQALGCQWMHAFVMSAEWAAHFSRTEASVPDCQQMQWNHMKVCGLFFK